MVSSVLATPPSALYAHHHHPHVSSHFPLATRGIIVQNNTLTGNLTAIDTTTRQAIPQGPATDGGGTGRDVPAIIWMALSLSVGIPLSLFGIRGWRLTTGFGIGLAAAVASWASIINTAGATSIPDIFLMLVVIGFFVAGSILGCFEIGRIAGMVCLGIMSGLSFGVRIALLRAGLIFGAGSDGSGPGYVLGWAMIGVLGVLGGLWIVLPKFQRSGMLFACAAAGTFLVALGVDLILHEQSGIGRGLIFLFDRNPSHIVDVITASYKPPLATQVILGVSLGLIPILAFAQHKLFKAPFNRNLLRLDSDSLLNVPLEDQSGSRMSSSGNRGHNFLMRHRQNASNIFSGLWDGALFKGRTENRFSV